MDQIQSINNSWPSSLLFTSTFDVYSFIWWIIILPLCISLSIQFIIPLILYLTLLIGYIYQFVNPQVKLINQSDDGDGDGDNCGKRYDGFLKIIAAIWKFYCRLFYDIEINGMENIINTQPALIIFYHGAIPIDIFFLMTDYYLKTKRLIYTITDRIVYRIPGSFLLHFFHIIPGNSDDCVMILKKGKSLLLSPGGTFEAFFSDTNSTIVWNGRKGFARIVKQTNVPIILVYTRNIRFAFIQIPIVHRLWQKIYQNFRIPILIHLGLPVKLFTMISEPIHFPHDYSIDQIALETETKMAKFIRQNQTKSNTTIEALKQRFLLT
ncbi:transmembrane protein 68-like protein 1 [Dermatophagoides farinae]|uniref:Transmembrane protein 68-like protein 1 n=1 Tax=Dermatophagoides farinae TaxID=6954 RepID=A0A9D4SKB0_DERFA|nr:transmembrane protein 68-like protein 1 [Dermatophagoides farinae]